VKNGSCGGLRRTGGAWGPLGTNTSEFLRELHAAIWARGRRGWRSPREDQGFKRGATTRSGGGRIGRRARSSQKRGLLELKGARRWMVRSRRGMAPEFTSEVPVEAKNSYHLRVENANVHGGLQKRESHHGRDVWRSGWRRNCWGVPKATLSGDDLLLLIPMVQVTTSSDYSSIGWGSGKRDDLLFFKPVGHGFVTENGRLVRGRQGIRCQNGLGVRAS